METCSALLAYCAGNSPVTGEFPAQRPATRSFDVFFDPRLNKRVSKQWWGWWFETQSGPLWRHCNSFAWLGRISPDSMLTRQGYNCCLQSPHSKYRWFRIQFQRLIRVHIVISGDQLRLLKSRRGFLITQLVPINNSSEPQDRSTTQPPPSTLRAWVVSGWPLLCSVCINHPAQNFKGWLKKTPNNTQFQTYLIFVADVQPANQRPR